jgi:aldose sugar dehydrogenase
VTAIRHLTQAMAAPSMHGVMVFRAWLSLAAVVVLMVAGLPAGAQDAEATATEWSFPHSTPVKIVPLPQGGLLVAALTGQIYHYTASGVRTLVKEVPAHPPTGEFGLLGMAIHPDYPADPHIYVLRTDPLNTPKTQSILRFTWLPGGSAGELGPVVSALPANPVCCHNGGRIAFGPDGMLYATLGDLMVASLAQNPHLEPGSVLRYTPDGDVPADNPFHPSPVYVWGLRNTFGLTFDSEYGLIVTDNGPSTFDGPGGFDRLFIGLETGSNAGWPLFYGLGNAQPPAYFAKWLWNSGTTPTAPTGVTVPRSSAVPDWDGKVIWCNYNQNQARIIDPADPTARVITAAPCRFDVAQDSQGRIIFATTSALWVIS